MKTIILSTDFSDGAKNACKFAIQLFRNNDVKYVLLNSYYEPPASNDIVNAPDSSLKLNSEKNIEKEKLWLLNEFPDWKLDITVESTYGMNLAAINEAVKTYFADYVVMSNKSNYEIDSILMGQKTSNIVNKIDCPVLAIPETFEYRRMDKIALASDLKEFNRIEVLEPLKNMLTEFDFNLKVFHVSPEENKASDFGTAPVGKQLVDFFEGCSLTFEQQTNTDVSEGLIEFTQKENCGILAVVDRKRNFFSKMFDPSKSKKVSQMATVPTLLLKG